MQGLASERKISPLCLRFRVQGLGHLTPQKCRHTTVVWGLGAYELEQGSPEVPNRVAVTSVLKTRKVVKSSGCRVCLYMFAFAPVHKHATQIFQNLLIKDEAFK